MIVYILTEQDLIETLKTAINRTLSMEEILELLEQRRYEADQFEVETGSHLDKN